jgi:hypothetical protein
VGRLVVMTVEAASWRRTKTSSRSSAAAGPMPLHAEVLDDEQVDLGRPLHEVLALTEGLCLREVLGEVEGAPDEGAVAARSSPAQDCHLCSCTATSRPVSDLRLGGGRQSLDRRQAPRFHSGARHIETPPNNIRHGLASPARCPCVAHASGLPNTGVELRSAEVYRAPSASTPCAAAACPPLTRQSIQRTSTMRPNNGIRF